MRFVRLATWLSVAVCVACAVAVVLLSDLSRFDLGLLALFLGLAVLGEFIVVEAKNLSISGAFLAISLAMVLLGPAWAAAIAAVASIVDTVRRNPDMPLPFTNLAAYVAYPVAGGIFVHESAVALGLTPRDANFALVVLAGMLLAVTVNFVLVALTQRLARGIGFWDQARRIYAPLLPSQLVVATLGGLIVYAYARGGAAVLTMLLAVVFLYQYLLRELLLSKERAEQLEKRGRQLASLQVGVLTAMLQTLSLRDKMTARHCAAVARYAREIAREAGCDAQVQDLVHTAGLLHDIGKFIFPDHILLADRKLDDADWEIVKMHPAQGAKVVRQVEGYGPVADIIHAHHEKIDGKGYPRGLKGDEIPLLSRMISIADTYDVMTARDSYREPVTPAEAIAELRRVSGTQLDGDLVELFLKVLERKGVAFHHGDDADFETELDLERRIRAHAEPR